MPIIIHLKQALHGNPGDILVVSDPQNYSIVPAKVLKALGLHAPKKPRRDDPDGPLTPVEQRRQRLFQWIARHREGVVLPYAITELYNGNSHLAKADMANLLKMKLIVKAGREGKSIIYKSKGKK